MTLQALFLLLAAGLVYIVVVFFAQNYRLFRNTEGSELLRLLGRTLLLWSPILLFYLPQYFLNREIRSFTTRTAYESGLIEHHSVTEKTTLYELNQRLEAGELGLPDLDSSTNENLRDALIYATRDSTVLDDSVVFRLRYALSALEPELVLTTAVDSAIDLVGRELDLVVRKRGLVGENEFQLDTELTLQDIFRDRESQLAEQLDSLDRSVTESVQATLDSINQNLSATSATAKEDVRAARLAVERKTFSQLDELERQTISAYQSTFPPRLTQISARFGRSDCGIPGVGCRVLNGVKGILRGVYAEERTNGLIRLKESAARRKEAARQKVRNQLETAQVAAFARIDRGEDGVSAYKDSLLVVSRTTTEALLDTKAGMRELRLALNGGVRDGMWALQRYLRYLRLASLAVFVFLVITSFIYVFSRVAFARNTNLFMTLRKEDAGPISSGMLRSHGTEYVIPADHTEAFCVSKKFVPTGRAPKLVVPQPLVSTFRRLVTGTLFMNEVAVRHGHDEPVEFRSVGGAEFVEWTLGSDDEIVFTYDHLVAFTDGIRLKSHFSLRLTTLLIGRPFFYIARGPGKVVLITKGSPILSGGDEPTRSVSAGRVVAWQRPALFSVQAETGMVDIYFSGLYLQRSSAEWVLIDADDGKTRQRTGLIRFVLRFLLPI